MSKLDNLEAYKRRVVEDDDYLIPVDLIDEFDRMNADFYDLSEHSEEWYAACEVWDDKFSKYIVDGKQFDIVYYIDPKDLTT